MEVKPQKILNFKNESDYDLIAFMALRDDDPEGARLAWGEFHERHIAFLYGVLKTRFLTLFDMECIEGFATDTILKAFEKARDFVEVPGGTTNDQRRHIRSWLGVIATNLLNTELRKQDGLHLIRPADDSVWEEISFDSWNGIRSTDISDDDNKNLRLSWILEAFLTLDEREERILRITAEYERPHRNHQRLPNSISAQLARLFSTTPENIRQLRFRAKKKVRDYVQKKEIESKRNPYEKQRKE